MEAASENCAELKQHWSKKERGRPCKVFSISLRGNHLLSWLTRVTNLVAISKDIKAHSAARRFGLERIMAACASLNHCGTPLGNSFNRNSLSAAMGLKRSKSTSSFHCLSKLLG